VETGFAWQTATKQGDGHGFASVKPHRAPCGAPFMLQVSIFECRAIAGIASRAGIEFWPTESTRDIAEMMARPAQRGVRRVLTVIGSPLENSAGLQDCRTNRARRVSGVGRRHSAILSGRSAKMAEQSRAADFNSKKNA